MATGRHWTGTKPNIYRVSFLLPFSFISSTNHYYILLLTFLNCACSTRTRQATHWYEWSSGQMRDKPTHPNRLCAPAHAHMSPRQEHSRAICSLAVDLCMWHPTSGRTKFFSHCLIPECHAFRIVHILITWGECFIVFLCESTSGKL